MGWDTYYTLADAAREYPGLVFGIAIGVSLAIATLIASDPRPPRAS